MSYVVPVAPDGAVLLVAHRSAGRWLPPEGHVEPGEHPADTARREAAEVRWWSRRELAAADPATRDPHLDRFLAAHDLRA